jgi:hypothetical protein
MTYEEIKFAMFHNILFQCDDFWSVSFLFG